MPLKRIIAIGAMLAIGLLTKNVLKAQEFYDPSTVNTIQIYFTQTNWDQLLDALVAEGEEGRLVGTAVINGVSYDSVGVRYKGNSSYSPNRNKNPLNIKLDYIYDEQLLQGVYGTIKLANGFNDPSLLRETLSYEIARKYMPASQANYADVYINDQHMGIYTSVQDVDSYFMQTHLFCSGKPRFKCDSNPTGNPIIWGYLGPDSTAYAQTYEIESDYGWENLIAMTYALNNNAASLPNVLNIDRHLWFLAFENLMDNFDSPINIMHNFYLFGDNSDRINPIVWDLNESFGVFNHVGSANLTLTQLQQYNPLANSTSPVHTLISNVLSNPRYKKMYLAHMRTMIEENFLSGWYATRGMELQGIVAPYVQNDPNFFFTYANFLANLNTTISGTGPGGRIYPGITALMNPRASYLFSHAALAGTLPEISSLSHFPDQVLPNTTVQFTLAVSDANYALLGLRQNQSEEFVQYQMFDDGNHGDGVASDGVFGISVPIAYGDIDYYAWAENDLQGAFYPPSAEHEFISIDLPSLEGALIINEINYNSSPQFDPEDWVELFNPSAEPLDISSWILKDDDDDHIFVFPAGTVIPPNGFLIICRSLGAFQSSFPLVQNALGDMDFGFGSSGDAIRIFDSTGELIDSVTYGVQDPWPTAPNGSGSTLELISAALDNSMPSSWSASSGYGTPGAINSSVAIDDPLLPSAKVEVSVWPNPFNPDITIRYHNPQRQTLDITVYNLKGQAVKVLDNGIKEAGTYTQTWNGLDNSNKQVASGVYILRFKPAGSAPVNTKLVLMK